jgi:hypothetical protein
MFRWSAVKDAMSLALQQVREKLTNQCVSILTAYRKHCTAANSGPGQVCSVVLVLDEFLGSAVL